MSSARKTDKTSTPSALIFWDFDGVIHNDEALDEKSLETFNNAGFIGGKLLNEFAFKKNVQLSIKCDVRDYVISIRPDNKKHKDYIITQIKSVDGFAKGIGGFHEEDIICLGIEKTDKKQRRFNLGARQTKLKTIEDICKAKYSHLTKDQILFIDNESQHLDPVKNAGYVTFLAVDDTSHFNFVSAFLQNIINKRFIGADYDSNYEHGLTVFEQPEEDIDKEPTVINELCSSESCQISKDLV